MHQISAVKIWCVIIICAKNIMWWSYDSFHDIWMSTTPFHGIQKAKHCIDKTDIVTVKISIFSNTKENTEWVFWEYFVSLTKL